MSTQVCGHLTIYQNALDIARLGQMGPVDYPYAPGAGRPPASLVGRDRQRAAWQVAVRLQKRPSSLGPVRAYLIGKGLVYAPEHGVVAFTVPGMADFIHRQVEP